jgi:hypothetical protein
MTHYDKLIDSIKQELYEHHINTSVWDERSANETSHKILQIVEEFQTVRKLKIKKRTDVWRASD